MHHQRIEAGGINARPLFVATIVTGSFLLFLTQPMIARMALPRLGGAPAVWNSAMLVYQALLLGGYAYAHAIARLPARPQAVLHLALFAAAALWLPIGLADIMPAGADPVIWTPWFLALSIGPLFLTVAAQAPLMQRWYALDPVRGDPYPLYAASNLGSFGGLICYPLLVEPLLTLEAQSLLWSGGYLALAVLTGLCALSVPRAVTVKAGEHRSERPALRRIIHWMVLAAVPSGLMLSTTTYLTTDIVAMPLLWVLPLAVYLLSFTIAFGHQKIADAVSGNAPVLMLIAGGVAFSAGARHPLVSATLGIVLLYVVAVTLHAELHRRRPSADRLTGFYLAMSAGGAAGGAFCAILAPLAFDWTYEHPLLILAAALLIPHKPLNEKIARLWSEPRRAAALSSGLPAITLIAAAIAGVVGNDVVSALAALAIGLVALLCVGHRLAFATCLVAMMLACGGMQVIAGGREGGRVRSYFGVYQTVEREGMRWLMHGTTVHGIQNLDPSRRREPTSYYGASSGVGRSLLAAEGLFGPAAKVGVVGLGTGTLACYSRPGQEWTFLEIDPEIVRIATDRNRFTYLSECTPTARIVVGDARLTLGQMPADDLDLLAIDAFSSDSVPTHLLTQEAFSLYDERLQERGMLLLHISNRHLDLEPVIAAAAARQGWTARVLLDQGRRDEGSYLSTSLWIAMSKDPDQIARLTGAGGGWRPIRNRDGFSGWTDDYASVLPLIMLR